MTFTTLGLDAPLLRAVEEKGYTNPSPIQQKAIPGILAGEDLMAAAQTGTGKTAGFTLPLLQLLNNRERVHKGHHPRALVLTPTRELAAQVQDSVKTYGKHLGLKSMVVFGGVNINPQIKMLARGVDILVATPGRLLDLHGQGAVRLDAVEIFVLDEADRMLDMGFIRDIRRVLPLLPKVRQNLLFSATFSNEIRNLARGFLTDPKEISVTPRNSAAETVSQTVITVDKAKKAALLCHLIKTRNLYQVLVFSRTKHGANKLVQHLEKHEIKAAAIHGNKSQNHRTRVLAEFKSGQLQVLVATDIAARGIDISQLPHVINHDLPQVAEDYVHRIGRTGRAGAEGDAISLVCADEADMLKSIERLMGKSIPREEIEGFEATHVVPEGKASPAIKARPSGRNKSSGNRRSNNNSNSNNSKKVWSNKGKRDGNKSGSASNGRNSRGHTGGQASGQTRSNSQAKSHRASANQSGQRAQGTSGNV
jgi:ATP-dependent RNA helicase RhlE